MRLENTQKMTIASRPVIPKKKQSGFSLAEIAAPPDHMLHRLPLARLTTPTILQQSVAVVDTLLYFSHSFYRGPNTPSPGVSLSVFSSFGAGARAVERKRRNF